MYKASHIRSAAEFDALIAAGENFAPISVAPWGGEYRPESRALLGVDFASGCFRVFLESTEPADHMRITVSEADGPVWEDSCLEFFVRPMPAKGTDYFNFENNPNGAMLCGVHSGDINGQPGVGGMWDMGMTASRSYAGENMIRWSVKFRVPFSYFKKYLPDFEPKPGDVIMANFYKCGDKSAQKHYLAWHDVRSGNISFHCPELFGEIEL